jgi:hypothetical protein
MLPPVLKVRRDVLEVARDEHEVVARFTHAREHHPWIAADVANPRRRVPGLEQRASLLVEPLGIVVN